MAQQDLSKAAWIKSSYSDSDGGNCLEVAPGFPALVPVRDSKAPAGPVLALSTSAWATFVESIRD
ncbi:DUF397 domain-containing protein [Streptomyces sp. NPDC094032]|uniref:DUF397 domain-containing protein n=1 Tax=Streptomyces sp. NPDC094032 TaxID=3155308 RepID=UPI00331ED9E8